MRVMTSARSCCVSTAVTEALLGKSLFLCSGEYILESLTLTRGSVALGVTNNDISSDSATTILKELILFTIILMVKKM